MATEAQYIRLIQRAWGNALKLYPEHVLAETRRGKLVPLSRKVEIVRLYLTPPTTNTGWINLTRTERDFYDEFSGEDAEQKDAEFRRLARKALAYDKLPK